MPRRSAADESVTVGLTKARAKSENLRAQKLKQEIETRKRNLVPVEEAQETWSRIAGIIRDGVMALPSRCALRCDGKSAREIQVILHAEVAAVLGQIPERIMAEVR